MAESPGERHASLTWAREPSAASCPAGAIGSPSRRRSGSTGRLRVHHGVKRSSFGPLPRETRFLPPRGCARPAFFRSLVLSARLTRPAAHVCFYRVPRRPPGGKQTGAGASATWPPSPRDLCAHTAQPSAAGEVASGRGGEAQPPGQGLFGEDGGELPAQVHPKVAGEEPLKRTIPHRSSCRVHDQDRPVALTPPPGSGAFL